MNELSIRRDGDVTVLTVTPFTGRRKIVLFGGLDKRLFEEHNDEDVLTYISEMYSNRFLTEADIEYRQQFFNDTTRRVVEGDDVEYYEFNGNSDEFSELIVKLVKYDTNFTPKEQVFLDALMMTYPRRHTQILYDIYHNIIQKGVKTLPFKIVVNDNLNDKLFLPEIMVRKSRVEKDVSDVKEYDRVSTKQYGAYDKVYNDYKKYYTKCGELGIEPHDCEAFIAIKRHLENDDRFEKKIKANIKFLSVLIFVVIFICWGIFHTSIPSDDEIYSKGFEKSVVAVTGVTTTYEAIGYVHQYYPVTFSVYTEKQLRKELLSLNKNADDRFLNKEIKIPVLVPRKTDKVERNRGYKTQEREEMFKSV